MQTFQTDVPTKMLLVANAAQLRQSSSANIVRCHSLIWSGRIGKLRRPIIGRYALFPTPDWVILNEPSEPAYVVVHLVVVLKVFSDAFSELVHERFPLVLLQLYISPVQMLIQEALGDLFPDSLLLVLAQLLKLGAHFTADRFFLNLLFPELLFVAHVYVQPLLEDFHE